MILNQSQSSYVATKKKKARYVGEKKRWRERRIQRRDKHEVGRVGKRGKVKMLGSGC